VRPRQRPSHLLQKDRKEAKEKTTSFPLFLISSPFSFLREDKKRKRAAEKAHSIEEKNKVR
jgi:hypothetical protein